MNEQGIFKTIVGGLIVAVVGASIHIFQDEIKQCMGLKAGFCPLTSEVTYDGGGRYKGDTLNGKPQGKGVFISANSGRYEGEFKNGTYNGKGVLTYANGNRHEVEWKNNNANGKGVYIYANGDRIEGEWKDDSYVKGVYFYKNGDRYEGDWSKDGTKRNGIGTLTYADGSVYVGEFQDGEINGKGNITFPKGKKTQIKSYDGYWKNGKYNGWGTMIWYNGSRYEGQWLEQKLHGYGEYTGSNGDRYKGQWENDKRNGSGTMIYSDGTRKEQFWKNDELVKLPSPPSELLPSPSPSP